MATWVPAVVSGFDEFAAQPVQVLMPASADPIYNSAPLFIPCSTVAGTGGTDVYSTS